MWEFLPETPSVKLLGGAPLRESEDVTLKPGANGREPNAGVPPPSPEGSFSRSDAKTSRELGASNIYPSRDLIARPLGTHNRAYGT